MIELPMIELPVGTTLYYNDMIGEVAEKEKKYTCEDCIFIGYGTLCVNLSCNKSSRHDKKSIYFKEVKDD